MKHRFTLASAAALAATCAFAGSGGAAIAPRALLGGGLTTSARDHTGTAFVTLRVGPDARTVNAYADVFMQCGQGITHAALVSAAERGVSLGADGSFSWSGDVKLDVLGRSAPVP